MIWTPTNASWLNPIECQFTPVKEFAIRQPIMPITTNYESLLMATRRTETDTQNHRTFLETALDRSLIVHADDFGLCHGINKGVMTSHREGILTSASVMANTPGFDEAMELAKGSPSLDIGLHLNLLEGYPVSSRTRVGSLLGPDGGFLFSHAAILRRWLCGRLLEHELEVEVRAQIEKVLDAGVRPSHIDGHKHIHVFPPVLGVLLNVMKDYGIRCMRLPDEMMDILPGRGTIVWRTRRFVSRWALSMLTRSLTYARVRDHGVVSADHFLGVLSVGRLTGANICRALPRMLPGVTELMCHPGIARGLPTYASNWARHHRFAEELAALCSEEVKLQLLRERIDLIDYQDILEAIPKK